MRQTLERRKWIMTYLVLIVAVMAAMVLGDHYVNAN